MCINLYTLPKRSIAMLSWNVLTTSRQLLVTQLRFRYMFLSASWEHLDSFVRLLLTILDELFLVLNMFHEFSKVHGPSDRSRIVKKCQELVTEVAKKYQDIQFGTLLVLIRIVGQAPQQKKHDKRDKRNDIKCLFNTSLYSKTWQTPLSP